MATIPNGFSVPMITVDGVLTDLGMVTDQNYGEFVQRFPSLVGESYILAAEAAGASKWTPSQYFRQWEDSNKPMPSFTVTADADATDGSAVTVTLTAGSHLAGGTLSPVAVGAFVIDDATGVEYEIRAVDKSTDGAHTATIAPTSSEDFADASIVAADAFFKVVGRPTVQEGSFQQDGFYKAYNQVERQLTIIRTNKKYSDLAKFEILDYQGKSYYYLDEPTLDEQHIFSQEHELMLGRSRDNVQSDGNRNVSHQGLLPQVQANGYDLSSSTAIDDDFWKDIARANDSDGWTNRYDILADSEFWFAYQDYIANRLGNSGAVVYGNFNGQKEIKVAFNFSSVNIYDVEYNVKKYAYFNSARTHGADPATGYLAGTAVFIPLGTFLHPQGGDLPYFTVRYMSDSDGGRRTFYDTDGALFGKNTERVAELALTSYKGLEMYNMAAFKYAQIAP